MTTLLLTPNPGDEGPATLILLLDDATKTRLRTVLGVIASGVLGNAQQLGSVSLHDVQVSGCAVDYAELLERGGVREIWNDGQRRVALAPQDAVPPLAAPGDDLDGTVDYGSVSVTHGVLWLSAYLHGHDEETGSYTLPLSVLELGPEGTPPLPEALP